MKKLFHFLLALVLLTILVYIGIHLSKQDDSSSHPVNKNPSGQSSKLPLNQPQQDHAQNQAETSNKKAEKTPTLSVEDNQSLLQVALEGELTAVMEFQQKMIQCRNKAHLVESAHERTEEMKTHVMDEVTAKLMNSGFFVTAAENTKNMCDQFYQQLNVNQPEDITDEETNLRVLSSIIDEADAGNSMARLLYALWAPTDRQSFLVGTALLEYEQRAMEYTLLNKSEHPQLALFALGRSYTGEGYFTPQHISLGGAYLVASEVCGLNSPVLEMALAVFHAGWQREQILRGEVQKTSELELNEQARNIANEFCPDFLRDSTPGLH